MTDNTHFDWVSREVRKVAEDRGIGLPRAFAAWVLGFVHEVDIDEALDQTDTLEGATGGDGGLDGWYRDDVNKEFHLWQCKWTDSVEQVFDKTAGDQLVSALENLLEPSAARVLGPKFLAVSALLSQALQHEYDIRLHLAVPTGFSDKARTVLKQRIAQLSERSSVQISLTIVDMEFLRSLDMERQESAANLAGEEVTFGLHGKQVLKLGETELPKGWRAYVASLAGVSLAEVAAKYGSRLFHRNVRFALPRNSRIKSIRETLSSHDKAKYFWFYNNGLTILADNVEVVAVNGESCLRVVNPQVVNGCQTVSSFRAMYGSFGDDASVLARIICPPPDVADEQAAAISQWTNSQNPVEARDLKTNDKSHRILQAKLSKLASPWKLEIKRGEWASLGQAERERYKDGGRRVDLERLGQSYRMMFDPAEALCKKRDLFENEDVYNDVFRSGREPHEYLLGERLRRFFWEFWSRSNLEKIMFVGGDALTESVLGKLLTAKGQLVSHSVALTKLLLQGDGDWSPAKAREGCELMDKTEFSMDPWLRHVSFAFALLVEHVDELNKAEDKAGPRLWTMKKYFERAERKTLTELWNRVSGNANIVMGKSWKRTVVSSLVGAP